MRSLWFVVPVHGRTGLAKICLRQLRRTCDALTSEGVAASAVVVGEEATLRAVGVRELGFGFIIRDNRFLGPKFNDGIQLATDARFNPRPVDYVVPCGSDDWVDHHLFLEPLPPPNTIVGFQRISFVREDGAELASLDIGYEGGSGIRIIPRELVAPLDFRPAEEDRYRACDLSILSNIRAHHGDRLRVEHWHFSDTQIVDWKTPGTQLNSYESIVRMRQNVTFGDPFEELAGVYPDEALEDMRGYYAALEVVAA